MGLYETIFVVLFLLTSLYMTVSSLYGANIIWSAVELREADVVASGQYGTAVSMIDAMKMGALGMTIAMGTWISAYSLGNTVDELIGWFDDWTDPAHNDASKEGSDKDDGDQVGPDGTSLSYDFYYHAITTVYSWLTFTAIMVGGQYFGQTYFAFKPADNCDLTETNKSLYSGVPAQIASITNLETCKSVRKSLFMLADLNKDNMISRCENAQFLYALGNTEEYALNYSEMKTLPGFYASCVKSFPASYNV